MKTTTHKLTQLLVLLCLYSTTLSAAPYTCQSITTGNWSSPTTWDSTSNTCGSAGIPTAGDDVRISAGHTVTVDTNASAAVVTINATGTLNFSSLSPSTLTLSLGLTNDGTFNATNASALSALGGVLIKNNSVFTIGSSGVLIQGFVPDSGSITLNGNITISGDISSGVATFSGTGKLILSDANHSIDTPVNLHNLEIAPLTAPRTITITSAHTMTLTGTTKLNGSSVINTIAFQNFLLSPSVTAFTSFYCSGVTGVSGITCNPSGLPVTPVSAPIDLISSEKTSKFHKEVELK